jgi:ketosteroid isomerase-like protein
MTETTDTTTVLTPREVFDRIQAATLSKDMASLADLYAEDAVHEWPFPPAGLPNGLLRGADQIRATLTAAGKSTLMDFREFRNVEVYETTDPEVIIVEYEIHGVITTTGKDFGFRYIMLLRVRDGRIVTLRDYFNPVAAAEATGRLGALVGNGKA